MAWMQKQNLKTGAESLSFANIYSTVKWDSRDISLLPAFLLYSLLFAYMTGQRAWICLDFVWIFTRRKYSFVGWIFLSKRKYFARRCICKFRNKLPPYLARANANSNKRDMWNIKKSMKRKLINHLKSLPRYFIKTLDHSVLWYDYTVLQK